MLVIFAVMRSAAALLLGLLAIGSVAAAHATEDANATTTSTAKTGSFNSIESLYRGNQRFQGAASRKREAVSRLVEARMFLVKSHGSSLISNYLTAPSFMFLGCTDNRYVLENYCLMPSLSLFDPG
jgi:hypothetical protein